MPSSQWAHPLCPRLQEVEAGKGICYSVCWLCSKGLGGVAQLAGGQVEAGLSAQAAFSHSSEPHFPALVTFMCPEAWLPFLCEGNS